MSLCLRAHRETCVRPVHAGEGFGKQNAGAQSALPLGNENCDDDPRSITDGEWLLFQFFLRTGFRLQEVQHVELRDVDFVDGGVAVKEKKYWRPEDAEEREVPVPDFLLAALEDRPSGRLFPQKDPLQTLLNLVKRAGLPGTWG